MAEQNGGLPPPAPRKGVTKTCPRCGARFVCGASTGNCWCATLPPLPPEEAAGDCHCPACLTRAVAARNDSQGRFAPFICKILPWIGCVWQ